MTASVDFAPLADAAADYRLAVGRLEDAAADAEQAWKLLPAALDSPGTQIGVGRFVGPAHQLSTALLQAADALHGALLAEVEPLRQLSYQAEANPDETNWARSLDASEAACAAVIAAIRGGEAGSVDLPCPTPQAPAGNPQLSPVSLTVPIAPTAGLPGLGALVDGATTAAAAGAAGLLGVLGLVLSMGGSSDEVASAPKKQRRPGPDAVAGEDFEITPYQPCLPELHGEGCEQRHLGVDKPGDEPFTGDKVKGDEPPGEMPGTESDWVQSGARNGHGQVYKAPDGREVRVMDPEKTAGKEYDRRYPNGYVVFKRPARSPSTSRAPPATTSSTRTSCATPMAASRPPKGGTSDTDRRRHCR